MLDPDSHNKLELNEDMDENVEEGKDNEKESSSLAIIKTLNLHRHPIRFIKMNWALGFCISIDERAFLEVWDP